MVLATLDCLYARGTGAVLAVCEVRLEDFEGIGHVGPTKANADMARLVVDRAWKKQDTGLGELFAVPVEVTDPGDAGEADRACRRADPRKGSGVPLEEAVEERQVAPNDREVAVEEDRSSWRCCRAKRPAHTDRTRPAAGRPDRARVPGRPRR